ncbi:MAG: hypothetical protein JRJ87_15075 [Deltaproteobacteria bacterium]|nr:hypothetical protein [Deltaproteobacteria bacterium]
MAADSTDKQADLLQRFSFDKLRFKRIDVISSGILYRGILIGADETDIYLKGALRWLILPLDRITSIKLTGTKLAFNPLKHIDSDFYFEPTDEDS